MTKARVPNALGVHGPDARVFWAKDPGDDWNAVAAELGDAFSFANAAAIAGESMVFVVSQADLLGQGSFGSAMVATALLSGARTAAIEGSRKGWTCNVIAYGEATPPVDVLALASRIVAEEDVSGELIRTGTTHLGKALP